MALKRYLEDNAAYFVTTVTKDRQPIFLNKHHSHMMLITIEYYKVIFEYRVLGYCLMPDHLHLVLQPSQRFNLSYVMQMLKGSFASKFNKLEKKHGRVWQRRFYEAVIRDDRQLFNQLDYMHYNPVKAGLVNDPGDYPLSSYHQYQGARCSSDCLPQVDIFLVEHP